jgi:Cof subfamily protein (haloacid dehalogenase superfamily)
VPNDNATLPPSIKYELIAIDVDGTLLNSDFGLSEGIEETLEAISTEGILPVLITGRTAMVITPLLQRLAVSPYYISDGGACVAHASEGIIALNPVRRVDAELITRLAREHDLGLCFHEMDGMCCELDEETLERMRRVLSIELTRVQDVLVSSRGDPVKITIFGDHAQLRKLDQALQATACRIHTTFAGPIYLEITSQGVSKGNALKVLADHLGIGHQKILAVGDQENDLSTFQVAGYAVAMGNAPQVVKQAADFVTRTNDEGGLAIALQRLLLNNKEATIDD